MEGISRTIKTSNIASHESSKVSHRVRSATRQPAPEPVPEGQAVVTARPIQREEVEQAAAELDKVLKQTSGDLSVSVDKATGVMVVKITDSTTGEVVKQIPPQELMEADLSMSKLIGLLIDDRG